MDTKAGGIGEETESQRLWPLPGHVGQEAAEGRCQEAASQVQGMSGCASVWTALYKTRRVLRIPYHVNDVAHYCFLSGNCS